MRECCSWGHLRRVAAQVATQTTRKSVVIFGFVPEDAASPQGPNRSHLVTLHHWQPFESMHIRDEFTRCFTSLAPLAGTNTLWAGGKGRVVERVSRRRSSPWSALSYPRADLQLRWQKVLCVLLLVHSEIAFTQTELGSPVFCGSQESYIDSCMPQSLGTKPIEP